VLCEKPMTMTVEEGEEIVRAARATGRICAVNYCYSAYPMVRQMRRWSRAAIWENPPGRREFQPRPPRDAADADNPRVRWRYDPAQAGVSGQFADCGIHALHMASFVAGDEVARLSADFASLHSEPRARRRRDGQFPHRRHGRAALDLVGRHRAAARARHPGLRRNRRPALGLRSSPTSSTTRRVGGAHADHGEGRGGLSPEADAALSRVAIAHPEGFPLAVANIYVDLAAAIRGEGGRADRPDGDLAHGGGRAALDGGGLRQRGLGEGEGAWVDARPPMFR
jgi:predicted dehydrogenase